LPEKEIELWLFISRKLGLGDGKSLKKKIREYRLEGRIEVY